MFGKKVDIKLMYANSEKPELFPYKNLSLQRLDIYYRRICAVMEKEANAERLRTGLFGADDLGSYLYFRCMFFRTAIYNVWFEKFMSE